MEIRLLGPFEVRRDGALVVVPTGRVRTLLVILALAAPDAVSADAIGRRLWGEEPPENLRASLQTLAARLRRVIGPLVTFEPAADGYQLAIDPDRVDATRFLRLIESASGTGERARLAEALGLWRGEPFGGMGSDWLAQVPKSRLVEAYLAAVERRVDLDLAAGQVDAVLPELRQLTADHPLREPLWHRLLTALYRSGRPAEALVSYDELRRRLADELGVDPAPELRRLHAELLAATESPMSRTPGGTAKPRQLPPAPRHFTGRDAALAELDQVSRSAREAGGVTIAAIHGQGGVGKTALALYWAHRAAGEFPDGQLYLDLEGFGPGAPMTTELALELLLRSLGVPGAHLPDSGTARTALLRTLLADRRILLVLDNARDAEQVRPLLPGSAGLVLITSRSRLRSLAAREGAHRLPLERFTDADAAQYLTATFDQHRVPSVPTELAELAALCGHLPLALAIAAERATRTVSTGLRDVLEELRNHPDRLKLLDVGEDDDGALRVVFDWSYEVLDPAEARMFRLLGLHPVQELGPHAAAALAAVSEKEAQRLLDELVAVHLVEPQDTRYRLHDLLRVYSIGLAEQLGTAAERGDARARIFDWYAQSALNGKVALERSQPLIDFGEPLPGVRPLTFDDAADAAAWFTAERRGLVAAAYEAARLGDDRAAYRIAIALWPYLIYIRALDELFDLQALAVEAAGRTGDLAGQAVAANGLGGAHLHRRDFGNAAEQLRNALRLFEQLGDERGRGATLTDLARMHRWAGEPEEAIRQHQRAIDVLAAFDDDVEVARNYSGLASAQLAVGRAREAVGAAGHAVRLNRSSGERRAEAFSLDTLAGALLAAGELTEAVRHYQEALALSRELNDRWGEVSSLVNLGRALRDSDNLANAHEHWRLALGILTETGLPGTPTLDQQTVEDLLAGRS
ncbi:DNA-binding SARP family transcriptional activator [Kribbella amoyensis]|uniref:DNA-binding SARP family transcriptional activator n=1 Tax=Kribbella amoyensis TaxID=996641 RepID=A0A561BXZ6_9ACTN|nr:BTAD domain-containing putative transcriptional regulator [Kribbella amoyensis]TWD83723.1 DNA-binding SARP family transcriptional activator [Kribbella amoyensis]